MNIYKEIACRSCGASNFTAIQIDETCAKIILKKELQNNATCCNYLCVGRSIGQGWNITLAMSIPPTCHSSAIALQQNSVMASCSYLCVRRSIGQGWNITPAEY